MKIKDANYEKYRNFKEINSSDSKNGPYGANDDDNDILNEAFGK